MDEEQKEQQIETFTLDGTAIINHEIDAEALADSLIGLSDLIKKSNIVLNKDTDIYIKILPEFHKSSFELNYIVHFVGKILPLVPQVVQCVRSLITLKTFLKGEEPKEVERLPNGGVNIVNSENVSITISGNTFNLYTSPMVNNSLSKFAQKTLSNGIDKITLDSIKTDEDNQDDVGNLKTPTIITQETKNYIIEESAIRTEEESEDVTLQIITPSFKSGDKWRFYDVNSGDEFSAYIDDDDFLKKVGSSEYKFSPNVFMNAKMKTVLEKTKTRTKRTRYIVCVVEVFEQN